MKVPVFQVGMPNANNRVYSKKCLETALVRLPQPLLIYETMEETRSTAPDISKSVGTAKLSLEDEHCVADCAFTKPGIEQLIRDGKLAVRSSGIGSIGPDGVIADDYQIVALFLTANPA
jgi:hypothetical protein